MHDEPFNLLGVSADDWAQTPESVQLALLSLLDIVRAQSGRLRELETLVRELQAKVSQTSGNSSKPPSSDPPSAPPRPPRPARGRKAGGQVGHEGHQRPLVAPDQVHDPIELQPQQCPTCQTALPPHLPDVAPLRRTQVWELPPIEPIITEYRQHTVCCPHCQQFVTAELPADAPPGAFGPRATALMALLRGRYRVSLDDVVEFLADVCQLPLSSASVISSCERVSTALAPVDAAIQEAVQTQPQVNVDETSWPTETRKGWLWVAFSAIAVCFRICTGRGQEELRALLGASYRGIVSSDRLSAYKLLPNGQRQLCWSHLLRNLLGLQERYAEESGWPQQMLAQIDALFFAWHAYKEGWFDQVALQQALIPVRLAMHELLTDGVSSPDLKIAGLSRELLAQWEALWTFSRVEGVEPTGYPLGERSGACVARGGAVAERLFRLAECGGLPICRAAVECACDLCAAGARVVRVRDCGGTGGVGRRGGADAHSSPSVGSFRCPQYPCVATERANDAQMGSVVTLNRTPLTFYDDGVATEQALAADRLRRARSLRF